MWGGGMLCRVGDLVAGHVPRLEPLCPASSPSPGKARQDQQVGWVLQGFSLLCHQVGAGGSSDLILSCGACLAGWLCSAHASAWTLPALWSRTNGGLFLTGVHRPFSCQSE